MKHRSLILHPSKWQNRNTAGPIHVLGQRDDKKLNVIHYASKTLDAAQKNYATTEKEFLAVIFACGN